MLEIHSQTPPHECAKRFSHSCTRELVQFLQFLHLNFDGSVARLPKPSVKVFYASGLIRLSSPDVSAALRILINWPGRLHSTILW